MAGERDRWEHLVLPADEVGRLTDLGDQGWRIAASGETGDRAVLYLQRPAPDFRERVTIAQREVYDRDNERHAPGHDAPTPTQATILHPGLLHLLASTGHTDWFTVCDRGFPVPVGPQRIDLALVENIPTVLDVLRAVPAGWTIDRVVISAEMEEVSPSRVTQMRALLGEIPLERISHVELKRLAAGGRATVRTGDAVPYANVIVVAG
ncbi:MAG TPA: D-ribose pyranase, partial [Thermomicrobiales bacterium]|nr:D-ribose pyranase [Thermomicrobiales bacterium]